MRFAGLSTIHSVRVALLGGRGVTACARISEGIACTKYKRLYRAGTVFRPRDGTAIGPEDPMTQRPAARPTIKTICTLTGLSTATV